MVFVGDSLLVLWEEIQDLDEEELGPSYVVRRRWGVRYYSRDHEWAF